MENFMSNLQGVCFSFTGAQAGRTSPPTTGLAFGRHYMVALNALQAKSPGSESLVNALPTGAEEETCR
jgi:hypothetical protein